ncbi:MAG: hypothetical protein Q7V19_17355 [Bacteroidales bacterium]|nr:hypothetical protein [Bacteroidales bacterium]
MKKITYLQAGIIAVLTLTIGVLMGLFIDLPKTKNDELAGSIGKVDRFRNVQITEDDILLRNELVEDTAKCSQYEKYLLFNYYQALKTSSDVERVLAIAIEEIDFEKVYYPYSNALTNFQTYLESARVDILSALNLILTIDENQEVPVVTYLNQAQNAIARIRNHDQVLLNYMNAMATYIESNPESYLDDLNDAHDILAMNVMHSALLTQNKPVLTYLEKKKLMNKKEGMTELVAEASMKSFMQDHFISDVESLNAINSVNVLQGIVFTDIENLQSVVLSDIEAINSALSSLALNSISQYINSISQYINSLSNDLNSHSGLENQQLLQDMVSSMENIQGITKLSDIESLNYIR